MDHARPQPPEAKQSASSTGQIDHSAMGHGTMPPQEDGKMDHGSMGHSQMKQGQKAQNKPAAMDHSKMNHGAMQGQMDSMDHSTMDHSQMNHHDTETPRTTSRSPIPVLTGEIGRAHV